LRRETYETVRPILAHFFPLFDTIGTRAPHCQRLRHKIYFPDRELDGGVEFPADSFVRSVPGSLQAKGVEEGNTLPETVISDLERDGIPAWVIESLR
jgi:hypothetical protein